MAVHSHPPSNGRPRLRCRLSRQNAGKPVDEKPQQDQQWDVREEKQFRSLLIAVLVVGAVAAVAAVVALISAWPAVGGGIA